MNRSPYTPLHENTVRELAALHGVSRPLTKTGRLTPEAFRVLGACEMVWETTLSYKPGPRRNDPFVLLEYSDQHGKYELTTGRESEQITVRIDRLNRARQIFHAFAMAFVTGDAQREADAFALLEEHQTEGVPA